MSKKNVHRNEHRWDTVGRKKIFFSLLTEQEQTGLDNQEEKM